MTDSTKYPVSGNLTFQTAPDLLVQSAKWMADQDGELTIDFASAGSTDSAGIALMLEWIELAKQQNKNLKFINIPNQIEEFVETNGLTLLIQQHT